MLSDTDPSASVYCIGWMGSTLIQTLDLWKSGLVMRDSSDFTKLAKAFIRSNCASESSHDIDRVRLSRKTRSAM